MLFESPPESAIASAFLVNGGWTELPLAHQPLFAACLGLHLALVWSRSDRWSQCSTVLPALTIVLAMAMHFLVGTLSQSPQSEILVICEVLAATAGLYSASLSVMAPSAKSVLNEIEEKLCQKSIQLASAARVARFCQFSIDLESRRVTWSQEALTLFGWSAFDNSLPTTVEALLALLHEEDRPAVQEEVQSALAQGHAFEFQARLQRCRGQYMPVHALCDIERSPEGEAIALHGVIQDVGPLMAALEREVRVKAEVEAAERISATKTAFISNMSHELRTPLNAIIGYSELLSMRAEDMTPDKVRSDLANVLQAGYHLLDLINDILDMAKIESGQTELDPSTFTAQDIIDETIPLLTPLLEANQNRLIVTGDALTALLTTDRMKLRQSLVNLGANAAKFTQDGIITLSADRTEKGMIALSVTDTGIGLTEEQQALLFVAFRQAHRSTASTYGGTGLGLAITRAHCLLMGGEIDVQSTPGQGTCFTMVLPVLSRPSDTSCPDGPILPQDPLDALIVEDDLAYGNLLSRLLTQDEWTVSVARTAEQALEIATLRPPRLLITDLVLPAMDGFELIQRLRSKLHEDLTILAVTSLDLTVEQKDELELSGVEILLKRDISLIQTGRKALTTLQRIGRRTASQACNHEER
ncbi:ATP-binding protein [Rhodospirillum sp. A1_3_36]|uniref:ATP-binding response regulator n=1 Tax=Rhodospirillum sp. A1_3_36 TaxID=3391666 RepID=UPI0039A6EE4F